MKHILQNHLRLLILAITPIFLTACGSEEPLITCAVAVPFGSMSLTAMDTSGQPLADYSVSYQINGGDTQRKVCDSTYPCVLGTGESGEFTLTVSKEGFQPILLTATVHKKNGCTGSLQTFAVTLQSLN